MSGRQDSSLFYSHLLQKGESARRQLLGRVRGLVRPRSAGKTFQGWGLLLKTERASPTRRRKHPTRLTKLKVCAVLIPEATEPIPSDAEFCIPYTAVRIP